MPTQNTRFHRTKVELPTADDTVERFVMSRDIGVKGAKCFAAFDSVDDALVHANACKGGHLYEVLEHAHRPCKLYLDVDRNDVKFDTAVVVEQVLQLLASVLRDEFSLSFHAVPGVNCQVSQATTLAKTSVHVVLDIRVATVTAHRFLAERLAIAALDSPAEYAALLFLDKDGITKCVIDLSVYSSFRSYRMLGMTKIGKNNDLVPFAGSSNRMVDHLVGYYPSLHDGKLVDLPAPTHMQQPLIQVCRESRRVQRTPVTAVPNAQYSDIEKTLTSWHSFTDVFPGGIVIAAVTKSPAHLTVRVDKRCGAECPYAKRCHKNNNLYIKVALDWSKAEVKCYDEDCLNSIDADGSILLLPNATNNDGFDSSHGGSGGMHAQADNVQWDELYDEPAMRPLPIRKIVCVRANMGIGKTVAIGGLLDRVCTEETKVLIVTFSRALAVKMSIQFERLGFVNYQNVEGLIQDAKVVTCLDSLYRVATRNFDYIIMDECVSTFLHFNSSLMNKRAENSALLELLLTQATTGVYFVDAALDFTFMKNIVDYFAVAKRTVPYYIYNQHVRPTSRKAQLVLCDSPGMGAISEYSLVYAAAMCVLDKLMAGEKVVCCSSTKRFTEVLARFVAERSPRSIVKVYNSSSGTECLSRIDTEWVKYDLLIYSPSISAGVSFELPHFDSLVAYLVSSPMTPSVDKALQQLFRVRNLTTGDMRLFVHDTRPGVQLPHTVEQIEPMLSSDISLVSRYFVSNQLSFFAQVKVTADAVEYDRDRLSWQIILGIIQMQNGSAMFFADTLVNTLRKDYNIPVDVRQLTPGKDKRNLDLVALQEAANFRKNPAWSDIQKLTPDQYTDIKANLEEATPEDRASVRLFDVQHCVWGVADEFVDENFYNTLVMSAASMDEYYRAKRFKMLCANTLVHNKERLTQRFEDILGMDDKNLELFKAKCKQHHVMLVTGHSLLLRLIGASAITQVGAFELVTTGEKHVDVVVTEYLAELSPSEQKAFHKTFGTKTNSGPYRTLLMVCKKAFNIEVSRGAHNCERAAWHTIHVQNKKLKSLEDRYQPLYANLTL
jgi:hypothetical protein